MDRITLTGVTVWGRHGVLDSEQAEAQPFTVDLTCQPGLACQPRPDDLSATVDYALLSALIADEVERHSYRLIETLADRIAARALALGGVAAVDVTVHKPRAPLTETFADVAVTVHRQALRPVRRAVVALGSNLGDRLGWLQFGLTGLTTTPGLRCAAVSGVYETAPVGVTGQPDYLNAVCLLDTAWEARALLDRGLELEALAGRVRRPDQPHGPRPLDIDLITVGDETAAGDHLVLPHPRAWQRAFVLAPWLEADPAATLSGRPVAAWLAGISGAAGQGVARRDDLRLLVPGA
jgi:dihydroneopterin aldolase/2-amino-4-hydroxy-6-hydroxymethyldihydropteridine diphosphokinase